MLSFYWVSAIYRTWHRMDMINHFYMIASILLFLPLMININLNLRESPLEINIKSDEVFIYAACALSACIPLMIDVTLDAIFCRKTEFLGLRLLSLISLVIYCSLFIGLIKYDNFGFTVLVFSCWCLFSQVFVSIRLIYYLDTSRSFSLTKTFIVILLLFANMYLHLISMCFPSNVPLAALTGTIGLLFYCGILYLAIRKEIYVYKHYRLSGTTFTKYIESLTLYDFAYYSTLSVLVLSIPAWGILNYLTSRTSVTGTSDFLKGELIIRSFLTIFTASVPGRMFKQIAIEEASSTNLKTEWVSFISHELRTPLHIMTMSLQVCKNDIKEDKPKEEILSTLKELGTPCTKALDLLNDLIYLEMTEGDKLKLNKSFHHPFAFITSVMRNLNSTARARNVNLKCNFIEPDVDIKSIRDLIIDIDDERFSYSIQKLVRKAINDTAPEGIVEIDLEIVEVPRTSLLQSWTTRQGDSNSYFSMSQSDVAPYVLRVKVPTMRKLSQQDLNVLSSETLKFTRQAHDDDDSFGIGMWIIKQIMRLHDGKLFYLAPSIGGSTLVGDKGSLCIDVPLLTVVDTTEISLMKQAKHSRKHAPEMSIMRQYSISFRPSKKPKSGVMGEISRRVARASTRIAPQKIEPPSPRLAAHATSAGGNNIRRNSKENLQPFTRRRSATNRARSGLMTDAPQRKNSIRLSDGELHIPLRLLVVDDSTLTRRIIVKLLKSRGHSCEEADDGSTAVEIFRTSLATGVHFDAILMDNEMPILKGRDAVVQIRALGYVGIILGVTGNVLKDDIDDFINCGADQVLLKPMSEEKFYRALHECQELKGGPTNRSGPTVIITQEREEGVVTLFQPREEHNSQINLLCS